MKVQAADELLHPRVTCRLWIQYFCLHMGQPSYTCQINCHCVDCHLSSRSHSRIILEFIHQFNSPHRCQTSCHHQTSPASIIELWKHVAGYVSVMQRRVRVEEARHVDSSLPYEPIALHVYKWMYVCQLAYFTSGG